MAKVGIVAWLEYDGSTFPVRDSGDPTEWEWFVNHLLTEPLVVHSNDIGDSIGVLRVSSVGANWETLPRP